MYEFITENLRITLKDLATQLKLSTSTISRALDDHPGISVATKERVKKKADELGFTPNSIASSFRKKKTRSIGVIVPRIDIHFHSLVISGIEEFAYRTGYNVTIFQSKDSSKRETEITKILQNRMVEGIIVCLAIETRNYDHFKNLEKLNVPIIFYDRVPSNFKANKIIINDFDSAFSATSHLIDIGCKNIAHIGGSQRTDIFKDRFEGYKAALEKYNYKLNKRHIKFTRQLSYDEGVIASKALLKTKIRPDGIFCSNDYTAISAIQVFRKAMIKIPSEIAIVGFSNYPISKIIEPNLTTVNDRAFEMGQTATKLLIRQIEDGVENFIESETITIKTELIIRGSTKEIINY